MRKFLRIVLIASWMIPLAWICIFPLCYLVMGNQVVEGLKRLTNDLWNGIE